VSDIEYGDAGGWKSPFLKEWGRPPGDAYSEERARWVRSKVRQHVAGQPLRQLRQRQIEMLNHLRMAHIERLSDGP
jgi:hypothetical protein